MAGDVLEPQQREALNGRSLATSRAHHLPHGEIRPTDTAESLLRVAHREAFERTDEVHLAASGGLAPCSR